jgi:hypothetical protein
MKPRIADMADWLDAVEVGDEVNLRLCPECNTLYLWDEYCPECAFLHDEAEEEWAYELTPDGLALAELLMRRAS